MGTNGVPKKVAKSCPNNVQGVKGNLGNTKRKDVSFLALLDHNEES